MVDVIAILGITLDQMIIRLPKEFNAMGRPNEPAKGSWEGEKGRMLIPAKKFNGVGLEIAGLIRAGAVTETCKHWTNDIHTACVWCREHDSFELLPSLNYSEDLGIWYYLGRHPRFSVLDALMSEKQGWNESKFALNRIRWQRNIDDNDPLPVALKDAILTCDTKEDFLKKVEPHLHCNLHIRGRRVRVTRAFKEKYKRKDFTVDDFFREGNQEVRRTMLRILPIKEITARMKLVATDEEGSLYDHEIGELGSRRVRRYLYVVCPSTKQEYLLEVPTEILVQESRMDPQSGSWTQRQTRAITSPKEARRWTFNVSPDAEFVKEA